MNSTSGLGFLKDIERNYEKSRKIKIDLTKTQYPLIRNVASNQIGWTIWGKEDQKGDANIFWVDTYITQETIKRLNPYQRINHFPNSQELCKKSNLSSNLHKMHEALPEAYDFFPKTWMIPEEAQDLKESNQKQKKWYIVKPASSSQGKGIYLTKQINSIPKQNAIVQQYIANPCLIDNCKFDLRLYVLIKNLNPLKIYRYVQGLTRISINEYQKPTKANKGNQMIHLTNYAINKVHPAYIQNKSIQDDWVGHKRSLTAVFQYLKTLGCDKTRLLTEIDEIIVKTVLAAYPKMNESYKSCRDWETQADSICFQVLGFDIIIDQGFKPWLLEVNHSPSFCTDSPLDYIIKKSLILDTFLLLNLNSYEKEHFLKNKIKEVHIRQKYQKDLVRQKKIQKEEYQKGHQGGYTQIYPQEKPIYSEILQKFKEKNRKKKKLFITAEKYDLPQTADNSTRTIYKKSTQLLTFYNGFTVKHIKQQMLADFDKNKEEAIRRHLFSERDKKKIEPIKLNNVNISFKQQKNKPEFMSYSTSRTSHRNRNEIQSCSLNKTCYFDESKTSDIFRNEIKLLDGEIRSRVGKIKMARIKLQKIKSQQRQQKQIFEYSTPKKILGKTFHKQNVFVAPSSEQFSKYV